MTEGSTYLLGAVPQAGCSTTNEGSGVAVEASLSLSGGNALGVGSFTATCSGALDNAGNPGNTAVVHYHVAFQFTGFSAPVDNPPVLNIARAGQIIPLRWRLTDANGNPVTNLADVTVTAANLPCEAGRGGDSIEEYATSVNSGLQNLGNGYYQWNWKTPSGYANSCKTLSLDLGEGAGNEHPALCSSSSSKVQVAFFWLCGSGSQALVGWVRVASISSTQVPAFHNRIHTLQTGKQPAAARTVMFHGISAKHFKRYYLPLCLKMENDNRIGRSLFMIVGQIKKMQFVRPAVLLMVTSEQEGEASVENGMSMVLWDMLTGGETYKKVLLRTFNPGFLIRFL